MPENKMQKAIDPLQEKIRESRQRQAVLRNRGDKAGLAWQEYRESVLEEALKAVKEAFK